MVRAREVAATLTVVGSGTLLPDADRQSPALHLGLDGRGMLLDCGTGTVHGLARLDLPWRDIEVVAVSHFHPDHVSDLPGLLQAFRYVQRTRPLALVGPVGFLGFMQRMAALFGRSVLEPKHPIEVIELVPGAPWSGVGSWSELSCVPTPHTDESVALRVDGPWGSLGYTGDTGPDQRVAEHLSGCSVLVSECALADPPELDTHLAPSDVARLARAARPELLVLTHVYPPATPEEAVAAVHGAYSGRVVAGFDGLRARIDPAGVALAGAGDGSL